jgi:Phytochelatin synthase
LLLPLLPPLLLLPPSRPFKHMQARFKYPPHWVPLPLLFEAMAPPDPTTGVPRGYLCLAADELQGSVLFTLDVQPGGRWRGADAFICDVAPRMVKVSADHAAAAAVACM